MAEMMDTGGGGKKSHGGKKRAKKHSTKIDMTPMVDLAFLLLTFFMLTTTFSKPQAMEINMPVKADKPENEMKVPESKTYTFILSDSNKVYWYQGLSDPQLNLTDFSPNGVRKFLLERNKTIHSQVEELQKELDAGKIDKDTFKVRAARVKADKDGLIILIKTDKKAKFVNVVDMLDEMSICNIGRYALVDLSPQEEKMLAEFGIGGGDEEEKTN